MRPSDPHPTHPALILATAGAGPANAGPMLDEREGGEGEGPSAGAGIGVQGQGGNPGGGAGAEADGGAMCRRHHVTWGGTTVHGSPARLAGAGASSHVAPACHGGATGAMHRSCILPSDPSALPRPLDPSAAPEVVDQAMQVMTGAGFGFGWAPSTALAHPDL